MSSERIFSVLPWVLRGLEFMVFLPTMQVFLKHGKLQNPSELKHEQSHAETYENCGRRDATSCPGKIGHEKHCEKQCIEYYQSIHHSLYFCSDNIFSTNSTRRFCFLPSSVSLVETGASEPTPSPINREDEMAYFFSNSLTTATARF